jgi:hypothetical protein
MRVDGGCHCGRVQYEAEVDPAQVVICHCTDCQALSGTAFRVVVATTVGSFRILQGVLNTYVKTGANGNPREQTFCGHCGSPIHSAPPGPQPKVVNLRLGTVRQRAELIPSRQIWHRSSLPWLTELGSIDRSATQPASAGGGSVVRN